MITVVSSPYQYTSSGNPVVWNFYSSQANLVYLEVKVYATAGGLISTLKCYTTPGYPNGSLVNLSKILESYVGWEFKDYESNLVDSFTGNLFGYSLVVAEKFISGDEIVSGATQTITNQFVFKGSLDKISFKSFRLNNHVPIFGRKLSFLTTKPDNTILNEYSEDGLYFLLGNYNGELSVKYTFFNWENEILGESFSETLTPGDSKILRINISPSFLANYTGLVLDELKYFKVCLIDSGNELMSEERIYQFESLPCNLKPVNVYWLNMYGVIDTYQFVNPENSLDVNRTTIKVNPFKTNSFGRSVDYDGDVFNLVDKILAVSPTQTIKLYTRDLSDLEAIWISGILTCKQALVKAAIGLFIPVLTGDTSISLTERRYLNAQNIKQFSFRLSEGFTPDFKIIAGNNVLPVISSVDSDFYVRNS